MKLVILIRGSSKLVKNFVLKQNSKSIFWQDKTCISTICKHDLVN